MSVFESLTNHLGLTIIHYLLIESSEKGKLKYDTLNVLPAGIFHMNKLHLMAY